MITGVVSKHLRQLLNFVLNFLWRAELNQRLYFLRSSFKRTTFCVFFQDDLEIYATKDCSREKAFREVQPLVYFIQLTFQISTTFGLFFECDKAQNRGKIAL